MSVNGHISMLSPFIFFVDGVGGNPLLLCFQFIQYCQNIDPCQAYNMVKDQLQTEQAKLHIDLTITCIHFCWSCLSPTPSFTLSPTVACIVLNQTPSMQMTNRPIQ